MTVLQNRPGATKPKNLNLDVIIVGAGIAGLTAAACCVEKGFNVTVLESAKEVAHVKQLPHISFQE